MSLKNRLNFHRNFVRVNHADSNVHATPWINMSEAHNMRVLISITGKGAGSTGNLVISVFGKLGGIETTVLVTSATVAAAGVGPKIDANILFDLRGLDEARLKFSYTNAPADYVDIKGVIGIPFPHPPM